MPFGAKARLVFHVLLIIRSARFGLLHIIVC